MSTPRVVLVSLALLLLAPAAAFASLADEQNEGRQLVTQLQSRAKTCDDLSAADLDHVGEYVMGRALGSTSLHQAMNERIRLMMGDQAEGRMHELMGARYVGCGASGGSGYPGMMGRGMMGGYSGDGGWGSMMASGDDGWMMGGACRQDWQRLERQWLGTRATSRHHGLSATGIVAIALAGALFVAALAAVALRFRPFRRPPAAGTA